MNLHYESAQKPTEGKLFKVKPLEIDRSKFKNPMKDRQQERTRQIIQEAFVEVDKYPEKYASTFYTLIPMINWDWEDYKTIQELKMYANDCGGEMSDWVEQALEWAQRITNGESWEVICNNPDTAKHYRVVKWKNKCARFVGGSSKNFDIYPPCFVVPFDYSFNHSYNNTVPLITFKKK